MPQIATGIDSAVLTIRLEGDPPAACGTLFRRCFAAQIPDFPMHYVARLGERVVGYYHITRRSDYALIGGLCVDEAFRRHQVASQLVHAAHADAEGLPGFFGYCGNPASYKLLTDAGYRDTEYPYVIVHWTNPPTLADKQRIIAEVAKLGPF